MTGADADGAAAAYEAALARSGAGDMRPHCRRLLVQLKETSPAAYEEAVRRYEEELVPRLAAGTEDPLTVWFGYGRWLATSLAPGRAVCIDANGRARDLDPVPDPVSDPVPDSGSGSLPPPDALVLHLPDDRRRAALVLVAPREPTGFQTAALEILVG